MTWQCENCGGETEGGLICSWCGSKCADYYQRKARSEALYLIHMCRMQSMGFVGSGEDEDTSDKMKA